MGLGEGRTVGHDSLQVLNRLVDVQTSARMIRPAEQGKSKVFNANMRILETFRLCQ
jgi:hypothetical protein